MLATARIAALRSRRSLLLLLPVCPRCGCCPTRVRVGGRCPSCGAKLAAGALAGVPPDPPDGNPRPPPGRRERYGIMIGGMIGVVLGLFAGLLAGSGAAGQAFRFAVAVGLVSGCISGSVAGAVVARLTARGP